MRTFYRDNKAYIDRLLFLLAFFVLAYVLLKYGLRYLAPFAVGYLISLIISPVVGFIQRKLKIARTISTIFLIIIIILLVAILAMSVFNRIVSETTVLSDTFPDYLEDLTDWLYDLGDRFDGYMSFLPDEFTIDFTVFVSQIQAFLTSLAGDYAMTASIGVVTSIPGILVNVFLSLISAFFFTRDKKLIGETIMNNLPEWLKTSVRAVQKGLFSAIGGYMRAQLTIMSVIAGISMLGLAILRYPYFVILGLVVCLFDGLPMIGSSLVYLPWAAINLFSGNFAFALGLIVINVACFLARQILEPKVLGQQIGLHPLLVLMGIYIGLKVFGVIGLFLGPALLVIAKIILKTNSESKATVTPPKTTAVQRMVTHAGNKIKKNQ